MQGRSIRELSKALNCNALDLNKTLLRADVYIATEFGLNDGFIQPSFADEFLKEHNDFMASLLCEEDVISKKVPHVPLSFGPCIYFLIHGNSIVYVGQSVQVLNRIHIHILDGKLFDHVTILPISKHIMTDVEQGYIYNINPRLNIVKPSYQDLIFNSLKRI